TTLTLQDKDWRPKINWTADVPASAASGTYTIHIAVSDGIAHKDITKDVTFRVVGTAVPEANDLEIVQLEYASAEKGPWNPTRYFSPTETVWVRYKIVGFQVSPENAVDVEQDLSVFNEEGKPVVEQQNAAVQSERSFYAPRFLPTIFSLDLKDAKP